MATSGVLQDKIDVSTGRYVTDSVSEKRASAKDLKSGKATQSAYAPTAEEQKVRADILKDFRNGWQTMHLPRVEFNDMSLYQRHIIDMLAFNTYQENDGNPMLEDRLGGWKSNAMRPVIRNKAISIAAHETALVTVPKLFAYDESNEYQEDAAKVMSYLLDWGREQCDYAYQELYRVIASVYSPLSWGYTEYNEVFRTVKDERVDGKWTYKKILNEEESGHKHMPIPTDQVFFGNFYERDPQNQDFIILRRVISYDRAKAKYGHLNNFQYVNPGIVVVMDDANRGFYNMYDPHMRQFDVEEVIRWRKSDDTRLVMVNGVLLSEADEANPRIDKQYPFDCFYYLPINERCIAGKSLVFAMQSDATIVNTLYQLIIDGSFLDVMPPTVTSGSDKVGMDVIVPGLNLAFADKDVTINPLRTTSPQSIMSAMQTLAKVESSLSESSQNPTQQGQQSPTPSTAYEISRVEQNAATVLGLSMKFIGYHSRNFGRLLLSDIMQYQTMLDADKITGDSALVYKTFHTKENSITGKMHKITFDANMPETMTPEEKLNMSMALAQAKGGLKNDTVIWKVNPVKFRDFKYTFTVDNEVINPRSADLTRAFDLETYDRAIQNPVADQEKVFTDLLMATNPKTARDPKNYLAPKQQGGQGAIPPGPVSPGNSASPAAPPGGTQGQASNNPTPAAPPPSKPIPSSLGKLPQEMAH